MERDVVGCQEVVRGEDLSLNDREEDLDLIEPAGMGWGMNEYGIRPLLPEALDRSFAAMNGSVIDDPEDSLRGAIGLATHDLPDEALEGDDRALRFAMTEDFRAVNIPCGKVVHRAFTRVLMLDAHRPPWSRRSRRVCAKPALDTGFLIGADDELVSREGLTTPTSLVEVENGSCFGFEVRVAREHPATMGPGLNGVLTQPTPDGRLSDVRHDPTVDRGSTEVRGAES